MQVLSQMRSESALAVAAMHRTNATPGRISSLSQHLLSMHVIHNTVPVQEEAGRVVILARQVRIRVTAGVRGLLLN